MPTELIVLCSVFGWFIIFILWCCCNQWIRSFFCKHEWEEVFRNETYQREDDIEKWLKWWVDIWYVCKKCKRQKENSFVFTPINDRMNS